MIDQPDGMYLAELNVARARYEIYDRAMSGFVRRLDTVNALAEASKGFVWRYKSDESSGPDMVSLDGDPRLIVNLSVWESSEDLEHFVWNTVHRQVYQKRKQWFSDLGRPHFVMWYVKPDAMPTIDESAAKLAYLTEHGPSAEAFGWESLPNLKKWQEAQCA
ncbi:MAG: DUF3291 domain-containing protein [Stappiaceae bacterium]